MYGETKMSVNLKKFTIITGHYGSGKTNFAANLALKAADNGEKVTVVDLDIVNPYFRSADFAELFAEKGISLSAPIYANTNLDIPALSFNIEDFMNTDGKVIIDVGGDDSGATALSRYREFLARNSNEIMGVYVINMYRYLTGTAQDAIEFMREIENASGLAISAVVNNSNLGEETTAETVEKSSAYAEEVCRLSALPLLYTVDTSGNAEVMNRFAAEILVKKIWET